MTSAEPSAIARCLRSVHEGEGRIAGRQTVAPLATDVVAADLRDFYSEVLSGFSPTRKSVRS